MNFENEISRNWIPENFSCLKLTKTTFDVDLSFIKCVSYNVSDSFKIFWDKEGNSTLSKYNIIYILQWSITIKYVFIYLKVC